MDKRKFSIIYWWGYYSNKQAGVDKPFIYECDGDEINDSNGWNEDDILEIIDLKIGDHHDIYGAANTSKVTVYRYV
jgi:hypothetical protein